MSYINEPPEVLVRSAAEELSSWRDERRLVPNFWDGTAAVPPCYGRESRAVASAVRAFLPRREIHRTRAAAQSNSLPRHRENPFTLRRREIAAMGEMAGAAKGFSVFAAGRRSGC